jgi:multidrug efflux pump subunit AcrB
MSLPKFSVENPVLVNMLMVAILVAGIYTALTLTREMFPESRPNQVLITTAYPGATPDEVEKGISIRIEEEIKDIEYIDKIETRITEGLSIILVSLTSDVTDVAQKVNEFKSAIDAIPRDEWPTEAEETRVVEFKPRLPVISVAIHGDADEATLKGVGRRLRDDLLLLPSITDVVLEGTRKDELTVEVQPHKLIEYGLSLAEITEAIRRTNLDLPGGQVKTAAQNVALRTLGETHEAERIADTIIRSGASGSVALEAAAPQEAGAGRLVRVRDVGRVIDGFEDSELRGRFNGEPGVNVTVYKTGDQDAIEIAARVRAFVGGKTGAPLKTDWQTWLGLGRDLEHIHAQSRNDPYPQGLTLSLHSDLSRYIEQRLDLLQRNGLWGLVLVFLTLLLTLNWRVAFWVMMGLVLSICGGVLLMSLLGATLNLISAFGLIVVLGLIVDDAIVVGENIYARVERGEAPRLAAVRGADEVLWPVTIAVATTIGAFFPLLFIEGRIGDFMGVLPVVVMSALAVSLIEALMILPAHMADTLKPLRRDPANSESLPGFVCTIRNWQRRFFSVLVGRYYDRLLRAATRYRYVTLTAALTALVLSTGLVAYNHVPFVFFPKTDSETLLVNLEMPIGTPSRHTEGKMREVEDTILDQAAFPDVKSSYTLVGAQIQADEGGATATARSHLAQIIIELANVDQRERTSDDIVKAMRAATRNITGVNSLRFNPVQSGPAGAEIEIEITGERMAAIRTAVATLKERLAEEVGVFDIDDDFEEGRRELQLTLLDSARALGVTTQALATEVRGAFYGLEARTIQRDREDVDIRVRFPEAQRRNIYDLESMRIATPAGALVPLSEVARITDAEGTTSLRRIDQRRAIVVSADVDHARNNPEQIIARLRPTIAELEQQLPGTRIDFAGNKRETTKSLGSLQRDFGIAILIIFVMLAGLFRSYVHPLVVLAAIPFGLTGAVVGHYIMGYQLTILSLIGLVALTGIVVNDALILVDFIKKGIAAGMDPFEAVVEAGLRRLRPIILTTLTTILGLAPLMLEQSFQARFLIPMAISISFGLIFATALTLLVVPALYLIVEDLAGAVRWLRTGSTARPSAA